MALYQAPAHLLYVRRRFGQPAALLGIGVAGVLTVLILLPLGQLIAGTLSSEAGPVWRQVIASDLSRNLFWRPLANTLSVGITVGIVATLVGSLLAWLVVLTDLPGRHLIGLLASVPYVLPSFAIALSWETIFRNEQVGGYVGVLRNLGVPVPGWLAWGFIPVTITQVIHTSALAFALVAAALASLHADLLEAAEMTGASRIRVLGGIALPLVLPAIVSAALLSFAAAVSNFSSPALLGLPVRFNTLSTRLYGAIRIGQVERGYALAILLIVVAAALLWVGTRVVGGRRSYATITGKGGRTKRLTLGRWRWPAFAAALTVCVVTTIIPVVTLAASTFLTQTGSLSAGTTAHYWIGASMPEMAQGQVGILRNPQIIRASVTTVGLGLAVAGVAAIMGLLIGYVLTRCRVMWLTALIGQLGYVPVLIPGIALGAAYIAQFGRPIGPFPALYGTFTMLVIAGAAVTLPFASQSGRSAMTQVSSDLEEAATVAGASLLRRLGGVFMPLITRSVLAGAVLVFIRIVRDLSLMVLLATPATPLLSVEAFHYASEGFAQFANAITTMIVVISVSLTVLARRLQGAAQPWVGR